MEHKNDGNAEVLTEIRSLKGMVANQGKVLKKHDQRLSDLEEADKLRDFAKKTIAEYEEQKIKKKREDEESAFTSTKLKLLRDLAPFIVAAAALLYALLSRHQ